MPSYSETLFRDDWYRFWSCSVGSADNSLVQSRHICGEVTLSWSRRKVPHYELCFASGSYSRAVRTSNSPNKSAGLPFLNSENEEGRVPMVSRPAQKVVRVKPGRRAERCEHCWHLAECQRSSSVNVFYEEWATTLTFTKFWECEWEHGVLHSQRVLRFWMSECGFMDP